jgi:hypothetical protein
MTLTAVTFFFLRLAPFVGMVGIFGFWFLEFAIPFMTIRWWIKFSRLQSDDPEFSKARSLVRWLGGGVSLLFLLLNLARLLR